MIEIDKGIPLTPPRASLTKYPWAGLEIGDSFFIPTIDAGKKNSAYALAAKARRRYEGRNFSARSVDGGVRIWRIA